MEEYFPSILEAPGTRKTSPSQKNQGKENILRSGLDRGSEYALLL